MNDPKSLEKLGRYLTSLFAGFSIVPSFLGLVPYRSIFSSLQALLAAPNQVKRPADAKAALSGVG